MAQVLAFPRTPAHPIPPQPAPSAQRQRDMVTAAMQSFMDGDPLTEREQRIVDTVLDCNYFSQLGRLAFGG
ncbi:hypothetical protein SAMN05216456_1283 [Devosia crocina]|uniref:Uncharacterized protein n=1 Tax=Devosia crocina TaxID=429728 RepID=A0A1I7N9D8_9HYPH|nr:hypothetical protein [Devosia crocina]SFV31259.1 hypothetical protein SAMN05216456_1283 [Devosia crocina]